MEKTDHEGQDSVKLKTIAAVVATLVPAGILMFAAVPSALAWTPNANACTQVSLNSECTQQTLNANRAWGSAYSLIGARSDALFQIYQTAGNAHGGRKVSAEMSLTVAANYSLVFHAGVAIEQCTATKASTCTAILAIATPAAGVTVRSTATTSTAYIKDTSAVTDSFGHYYRACGNVRNSNGWQALNVCSPYIAN